MEKEYINYKEKGCQTATVSKWYNTECYKQILKNLFIFRRISKFYVLFPIASLSYWITSPLCVHLRLSSPHLNNWSSCGFSFSKLSLFFFPFYSKLMFLLQLFRHRYLWTCSSGEGKNGQALLCTESYEHSWCHSTEARATCAQWKVCLERSQPPLFDQIVSCCIFLIHFAHTESAVKLLQSLIASSYVLCQHQAFNFY